jgi:ArsR family transcriptional regulator
MFNRKEASMNQLTNYFKLLSDSTRLRMILLLYQENLCVCELSGIIGSSQPSISKKLSKLRDMNLVLDERKEKFVYYSLKRSDDFFINILENIISNIDQYPELIRDRERLKDKDQYLNVCCVVD